MNFKKNFKRFFTLSRNAEGFTLVELIVVIAILGILSVVAVPAYTKYVDSAKVAQERSQLSVINSALAVACAINHESNTEITATLDVSTGAVTVSGNEAAAAIQTSYNESVAGNTFKFEKISPKWDATAGMFVDPTAGNVTITEAFNKVLDVLTGESNKQNLSNLNNSAFGTMGAQGLMDKMDWTSDIANEMLVGNEGGTFHQLITNCGEDLMAAMGVKPEDQPAKLKELMVAKMNQLISTNPEYKGMNAEEVYNKVMNPDEYGSPDELAQKLAGEANTSVSVNNAILSAASNVGTASQSIQSILTSSDPKTTLIQNVNAGLQGENPNTGSAMAEVAMAYAIYTAYAQRNNITVDSVDDVLDGLDDPAFQAYVSDTNKTGNFQADLDGYVGAMNMINNSVYGNEEAVTDVVLNGFANDQLVEVLTQAMNSAKTAE